MSGTSATVCCKNLSSCVILCRISVFGTRWNTDCENAQMYMLVRVSETIGEAGNRRRCRVHARLGGVQGRQPRLQLPGLQVHYPLTAFAHGRERKGYFDSSSTHL